MPRTYCGLTLASVAYPATSRRRRSPRPPLLRLHIARKNWSEGRIAECPRLQQNRSSDELSVCCQIIAVIAFNHCLSLRGHAVKLAMPSVASGRHSRQVGKITLASQAGMGQVAVNYSSDRARTRC